MSWYSGLNVNKSNFFRMARNFFAIQSPVFDGKLTLRSAEFDGLAYADTASNAIVVHENFLRGTHEFFEPYDWNTRLELFNAIIIHESAHFQLSPGTIKGFQIPGRKMTSNIATIANTVEDLYIEKYVERNIPAFTKLLYRLNDMIFSDTDIEERRAAVSGERPSTIKEASLFLHYAITFKRHNYVFMPRTDFERTVYEMYTSVFGMDDVEMRKALVYEIYDFIFDLEAQEQDTEPEESDEEGEGGIGGKGDGEGDEEISGNFVMSSFGKGGTPIAFAPIKKYQQNEEVDNGETVPLYRVAVTEHKDIFVERLRAEGNEASVRFTEMDFGPLTKVENARGSVRSVVGAPSYSGKRLTHLHRAGGDGKIFGDIKLDGHRAGRGAPEIVFLLDFSGSMRGTMATGGARTMKIEFALSVAVAINNALSRTKTKFSILGHTTVYRGEKYGLRIVELKSMNEIVSDGEIKSRCNKIHNSIQYAGNADGAALIYSAKEFSNSLGDKVLFIISDGQPAEDFTGYYVENGIRESDLVDSYRGIMQNVSTVAGFLRSKGIKLFSASIDSAAVEPCNTIYGKENNVEVKEVHQLVNMVMRSLN